jgi:uncharacterized coiled-coil protein SlyX
VNSEGGTCRGNGVGILFSDMADTGALEIKIAFLEKHIEEQDRVMYDLSRQMDRLERQVTRLTELVKGNAEAGPSGPASPGDERPPHY